MNAISSRQTFGLHRPAGCRAEATSNESKTAFRRRPIIVLSTPPSLRAQRSNPGATARGPWIASSQGLLAMTVDGALRYRESCLLIRSGEMRPRASLGRRGAGASR